MQQVGRNSDSVLRRMIEGQIQRNARWLLRPTDYIVRGVLNMDCMNNID